MHISSPRRWAAVALLALAGALGACGTDGGAPTTAAGREGATTTAVAAPSDDPGASPVEGLDAAQLQDAVTAPVPAAARRATGPTADRVTLADGRAVWRVRIAGPAPVRAARATVVVGDREVGPAVPTPDLSALVVVTADGTGLVPGAPVSVTWEGAEPVPAGALEVVS